MGVSVHVGGGDGRWVGGGDVGRVCGLAEAAVGGHGHGGANAELGDGD